MPCINKSHPNYKILKDYFGQSLTDSLVRNNKMEFPSIEEASQMIKGNKVLQFKKALNYLRSTTSASTDNLLAAMPRVLQRKGSDIYVLKGSRLSEQPSPGAKINVEDANISFLNKVNEAFGPIFKIEKDYGLTKAQIAEIYSFSKELLDEGVGVINLYADMLQTDPIEFFKFVSQQAQNLDANGNVNKNLDSTQSTLDSFGETIVNFAKELFPAKVVTTGLSTITGKETVIAGQSLPTRFQTGTAVGFVEESLKVARDSNNTMGSSYLTNAIYYAEGKVKGPAYYNSNVVLPYSNKKLADQLNQLKGQFQAIGRSVKDRAKKDALKNKIFSLADTVYTEFKESLKNNIRSIYEAWDSTLINRSKHWYDGANRIAQNFSNTYGLSLEASSAIIAVLSPQNEWFNNISSAYRVMDIMTYEADNKVTADMFEQALAQSKDEPFSIVVEALKKKYVGSSINDILSETDDSSQDIVANLLRVVDLAVHNRDVSVVLPEGVVTGVKQSGGTDAKFAWGSSGEIYKAISIFKNQDIENISTRLGKGNKVRNFYNNIANPNSKNGEVTVDTHAAGAGLLNVIGSDDTASMGLFRNDSVGNSPFYIVLKEAYQEVAKEKGLLPRELQSVTWEAVRLLINESSKTPENRDFINNIWKQVQQKKLTQNAAIKTIIGNFEFGRPEWVRSADPGTDQTGLSETGTAVQQDQRNASDLRGQQPDTGESATGVATRDVKAGSRLFNEPNPETAIIAQDYKDEKDIDTSAGKKIHSLDTQYSKRIADAFQEMKHEPNDPIVKAAYQAMAQETVDQFEVIQKAGYNVEIYAGATEPYNSSEAMITDVRDNKHMFIFGTETGFGDAAITDAQRNENPLLGDSGFKDINGKTLLVNDVFRFVHDFFGHSERGNGFGAIGEENAWDVHARMYTPLARRAMTTETRGQNSWVNFGPQMRNEDGNIKTKNDPGYLAPIERTFAEQKIGLLPEEFSTLPEDNGQESTNTKVAEGTFRVTIDEQKLTDLVEENKKNPTEVPFEDNIPDEQYQKASYSGGYWRSEQEKRFAVENIVRMLSKKFNIPFEYVNDSSLPWAAKFSKGKIVLNLAKIGRDSAFHEIAHPFVEILKTENPELYNALINELKSSEEGQKEIERVAKEYSELSPQEQLDEALVSLIGKNSSNQYLNSTETSPKKSLIQRFWDWVKDIFFNMGMDASTFSPTMSINEVASMISNPMFSIDLSRVVDLNNRDEYYQKKATQQMQRDFDALINDTITKLKADVNIVGKTEEENKRKYFSSKQVEELINDRKDINALNSFITSGLFNLKDINDRFNEFITKYEAKGTKSKEDVRNLSLLLNEMEDNITLYGNAGPLLESIFEMFPDEKDNFSDWAYSLKREKRLMNEYQSWGVNVVTDWLFPYQKKAVRKALASNNLHSVVSKEVYDNEVKLAAEEGITDRGVIIDRAVKQEIRNTLLIAKRDASGITGYLAGVLNSRDSIASTVGQAIMDELHKALTYGQSVETKFKKLMKQYRGSSVFSSNAVEKEFYQKYLRKSKVWTYMGLGQDAKPKYEYKEHTAFHEEYEWDTFYNAKREFFDKLGPVPSKTDLAAYRKYKAARDGWFAQNTVITKDQNGKDARIPAPNYKNAQFGVLQNDPLFKEMYTIYKSSNTKLGKQGLRYGIIPQLSNAVVDVKGFKPKNALEGIRNWIGEQEQVYFVQSIAGGEKPVVPINHVRLLDEKDLSYNLINSVSKFAAASAKYESMSMLEPQVQILKNFIGGNNALNIKKRRTIKRSASGIKALSRIIHDDMYVESTKLNNQLNSFLNDAVYGQSMKKDVVQLWDSKFEVFKTNDKSLNGGPKVETIHGFENVREFTGLNDLDYSGFEFGKDRKIGEWTIKMTKKDWNFSVKKTADRLGLLTALQTMIVNPISATVNIIRGKSEVFVESLGGRYYNMKDYAFGEKEYWKAIGSGDFFEDMKGGKPSFLSSMLIDYDALQGELIDASGRTLERGLVNKFFRTRRLFFAQNGGEHYIQTQLMIAMMNHQKIKTTGGETLSLFEARKREFNGQLKMSDTNWTDDNNREFRETLNEVNTRLNGNYNKTDKAMIQRTWWGAALMMFRKHIYNGLANRYRKGYVNYQTGNYTEGYWRAFAHGLVREIGEMARDRTIRSFNLNEQEKYAFKKFGGDVAMLLLFITAFKMFDDDDDDNEFNDSAALIFRRLVSESGQYTPIIAPLEAGKIAKNPSAISHTINNFYEAFKQTLADPTEEYERNGPGYEDGDNKAWKKWQRAIPGWRIVLNTQEPERLMQFYQQNSLGFLKPSAGKENEEETGNQ